MFRNQYVKRKVDPISARPCFICYKPTACVMVNEVPSADFFYICELHLSDPGFAKLDSEYVLEQKKIKEQQDKIAQLKAEWEKKKGKDDLPAVPVQIKETKKPSYELSIGVFKLRLNTKKQMANERKIKMLLESNAFPSVPTHKPE